MVLPLQFNWLSARRLFSIGWSLFPRTAVTGHSQFSSVHPTQMKWPARVFVSLSNWEILIFSEECIFVRTKVIREKLMPNWSVDTFVGEFVEFKISLPFPGATLR